MSAYDDYDGPPEGTEYDDEVTLNTEITIGWNSAAVIRGVIEKVSEMIYEDIKPQADAAIKSALGELANQAMLEMFDREVQPTDRWGKPIGEPVSIRATLQRDAEKWLTERVDYKGRKGSDTYGDIHPRIHWLFEHALNGEKDFHGKTSLQKLVIKTVKATLGDVTKLVEETVREQARQALNLK